VVVTHLDPTHPSMMPSLLQNHTEMKVTFVR
jgi:flavorubredoxin